jgi:RNA polymerase sigma factor (sigma-70 family)
MIQDAPFETVKAGLRRGDDAVATAVFQRYVRRLIALASRQFEAWIRNRVDVEDVVLSACKSFFLRNERGEFDLNGWDELWSLLATITLRKCAKRRRLWRTGRRDISREAGLRAAEDAMSWVPDRAPTPVEAAVLAETVEQLIRGMDPSDRPIVEQFLQGCTAGEIAARLDRSERTVRRVRLRAKHRLERLIQPSGPDA